MKVYTENEVQDPKFVATVEAARKLWEKRCIATYKKLGDYGSCVLGAGIAVLVKPKGKRVGAVTMILPPPAPCQGSIVWETSQQEIVQFLAENGIEAEFQYGFLD